MSSKTKKLTILSIMTAFALVLSYLEFLLPPIYAAVPGVKIGLPNVVIIYFLYKFSLKEAALVSLVRLLVVTLLFGNAMTLLYSVAGAVLSLAVMSVLKMTKTFSMVGVSVAGGVFHNAGQIIVAVLVLKTAEIGFYMPVLAVSGILAGVAVGLISVILLKKTERFRLL